MTTSLLLRFDTRVDGEAFFAALGMTRTDPVSGAIVFPSPGYLDGVRFDPMPLGGDGVLRVPIGRETVTIPGFGSIERPLFEVRPGWHVALLWHGSPEALPDFGTAVVADGAGVWLD